jgi:acylphosphatase
VDRSFRVRGRVQGVGFRWWTTREARDLGLRGAVRNLDDGSVAVRVAGSAGEVERMERRLQQGPGSARVEAVEREAHILPEPERGFHISRDR